LTSVVDPEEGSVRLVIFAAMAALLVVSLCVPEAFGDLALAFALAYGVVRFAHIALFGLASRDDPDLRQSVNGLAASTALGVALLVGAAFVDGWWRGALWLLAVALDVGGPFVFGAKGWKLVPGHFAERHGLIIIIALGESIVAIGVGARVGVTAGVVAASVLGVFLAATLWWTYFDVVAIAAARRLAAFTPGREQNEVARDAYSYLHFPMVAGIVLASFGLKETIADETEPLRAMPALGLCGGVGLYLLAHVAFRWRVTKTINRERLGIGVLLVALTVPATLVPAWCSLLCVFAVMAGLCAYETTAWSEARDQIRHPREAQE
jgi:low temperature requirement protein LtrA